MAKSINLIFLFLLFFPIFPSPVLAAFTIVDSVPSSILDNEAFSINVSLSISGSAGNSYFLRAAFSHPDTPTSYFGYTKNNTDSWYNGKPSPLDHTQLYQITMGSDNSWTGTIEVKPDPESSSFKGTGNYNFKIGRYTQAGSGPTWSDNLVTITITASSTPTPSPTLTPKPISTPHPTPSPTKLPASQTTPVPPPTGKILATSTSLAASVSGFATYSGSQSEPMEVFSQEATPSGQKNLPKILLIFAGFSILVAAISAFWFRKKKEI